MKDKQEFYKIIEEIDGREFSEYSRIIGDFDFGRFILKAHRIPEAGDSDSPLFVVRVPQSMANFPPHLSSTPVRRAALEDKLTRKVVSHLEIAARFDSAGVARRRVRMICPSQKILPRCSLIVTDEYVEARLYIDLPAREGRILGNEAWSIFSGDLPALVDAALIYWNLDARELDEYVNLMDDADRLRQQLPTRGLIGFVQEGALLARWHDSDLPDFQRDIPLRLDDDVRTEIELDHLGTVRGVGIPAGITVVLGDDYSGRIEFLRAVAQGIYNHIPGDGRELTISIPDAVYLSAHAGRPVQKVNISSFVRNSHDESYTTLAGDAHVGEAASLMEALEIGARALILDESDSAPGFLAEDARLAELIHGPSQTLAHHARKIVDDLGVSILIGGANAVAEFIAIADTVLKIEDFKVSNVTKLAKQNLNTVVMAQAARPITVSSRSVAPASIDASSGLRNADIEAISVSMLRFGKTAIDLRGVIQLAEPAQTETIGLVLEYMRNRYLDKPRSIRELLDLIDRDLSTEGLECLTREMRGDLVRPRRYEIAAALNRLKTLRIIESAQK